MRSGKRKEKKKSLGAKIMSLFMPTNTDATDLVSSQQRKQQAKQFKLRKAQAEMATKVAVVSPYMPILKLENGAYTRDEWECILHHSFIRNLEDGLSI